MLAVIDAHQHFWDLHELQVPWLVGEPRLNRSFPLSAYLRAAAEIPIAGSVYVEVDAAESDRQREIQIVGRTLADPLSPLRGAVVSARPGSPEFAPELQRITSQPWIKGARRVLHTPATPPGFCLQEGFLRDIRCLGDAGLSFDICIGRNQLADAAALIAACPETQFMLDHCGNADVRCSPQQQATWRKDISAIAKFQNVSCKVSGFIWTVRDQPWSPETLAPIVHHVRECFGAHRLVFGGDWPVCTISVTLTQWFEALQSIVGDWPHSEQQALFADNARTFYGLADGLGDAPP